MGFISRLIGLTDEDSAETEQLDDAARLYPWPGFEFHKYLQIEGDVPRTVNVYDVRPLADLVTGQSFKVEFYYGDAFLRNDITRRSIDTREREATCVMFSGKPFGVILGSQSDFRLAHKQGISLTAQAVMGKHINDHDERREVSVLLPKDRSGIRHQLLEQSAHSDGAPPDAARVEFDEWNEEAYGDLRERDTWKFQDVHLEFLPVPEGSQAKPHVVLLAPDGRLIARVSARKSCYPELAAAAENSENAYVIAEKTSDRKDPEAGKIGYRITLWHW